MICALISPTFSCIRSRQSFLPAMIDSRASLTQAGHRESVCRGKPSVGLVFSQDFSSGLSDHCGVTDGFGFFLLKCWIVLKVTAAVLQITQSIERFNCVPTELGINLAPPLCGKMRATLAPRCYKTRLLQNFSLLKIISTQHNVAAET